MIVLAAPYALLTLASVVTVSVLVLVVYRIALHPLRHYPGPWFAAVSNFYVAYQSRHGKLHYAIWSAHQKYGEVVRLGPSKLVFSSPNALHDIYMSKNVQKSKGYAAMLPAPNALNTLMAVDKARHRKRRKIVNQAFSDRALAAFEPTLSQHINVFLAQLLVSADKPDPVDVSERSRALALDVISAFSFGQSLDLQTAATNAFVSDAIEAASLVCGMYNQWPLLGALGAGRLFRVGAQTREQYGRHMGRLVAQRAAADKDSKSDLFAFLLDARDPESGERLLPHELWSESRLFMIAGSETVATALAAVLFYLARDNARQAKLAADLRAAFAELSEIRSAPSLARRVPYLRACIDEAMRLTPPVGNALWREVGPGGLVVAGRFVPAGTEVGGSLYATHRDRSVFSDPEAFRPERWVVAADNPQAAVDALRRAFLPFSLGTRRCLAQNMAYAELELALARVAWCFDFEGECAGDLATREHLTARTQGPWLRFVCRPGAQREIRTLVRGQA